MQPVSAGQTASFVNQARQQGQALQNQYNTQANQAQGQYNQTYNQANQGYNQAQAANQSYRSYLNSLPSTYTQDIGTLGGVLGYNPQATQRAAQSSANLAEAYANAPQAAQQMSNYSGATAGQQTQNLSNMSSNLQGASAQANQLYQNQLGAQQNVIGAVNNLTNQQSTGMGQYAQNANAIYSNAVNQMSVASNTMNNIEQLQQKQGTVTSQQVADYQNAYSTYIQAAASAAQANAQAQQTQQQINFMNQVQQKYGIKGIAGSLGVPNSVINPQTSQASTRPRQTSPTNLPNFGSMFNTIGRNVSPYVGSLLQTNPVTAPFGSIYNTVRSLF